MLALIGCGSTPETIVEIQEVLVPVFEPCDVEMPEEQVYATSVLSSDSTDFEKIRALLVERRQRMTMEEELRLLLDACSQPLNQPSN